MHFVVIFSLLVSGALAIESNFYREETCAQVNGYCVLESECPHSVSAPHKGLCSHQKSSNAVCCVGFPIEDVNCFQLHNDCRASAKCPKHLSLGRKGCSDGQTCCVLT